jgi:hypothetical protein
VWVGHRRPLRIDPQTNAVIARIDAAGLVAAFGEGAVWAFRPERSLTQVIDVDPGTNSVRASIPVSVVEAPLLTLLAAGEGAVWFGATSSRSIYRIDPVRDNVESAFSVGAKPSGSAAGLGSVWVTSALAETLTRVDPRSEKIVAQVNLGRTPTDVASGRASCGSLLYETASVPEARSRFEPDRTSCSSPRRASRAAPTRPRASGLAAQIDTRLGTGLGDRCRAPQGHSGWLKEHVEEGRKAA